MNVGKLSGKKVKDKFTGKKSQEKSLRKKVTRKKVSGKVTIYIFEKKSHIFRKESQICILYFPLQRNGHRYVGKRVTLYVVKIVSYIYWAKKETL